MTFEPLADRDLGPLTTLEVGGRARWLAEIGGREPLTDALAWARERSLPVVMLGDGSNVVVSDDGFDGLVLRMTGEELEVLEQREASVVLRVQAGLSWDALVARAVAEGWGGIECLSGIPGRVGAAPIQNIGAYGQEIAPCVRAVHTVERASAEPTRFDASACGFGYRTSRFKTTDRDRYIVTALELELRTDVPGAVRYRDLIERFGEGATPTLAEVRDAVLEVRTSKSMVIRDDDPNRRSAGSFFVNPIVPVPTADAIDRNDMPRYPAPDGLTKLSAAWLIENAGFTKGYTDGAVGLSSKHTLALINRGGATAADVIRLASTIRATVQERFGIELVPEPNFVGFDASAVELLARGE